MNTLDSIRAAVSSSTIPSDAKVAMLGYSGGAIATEWAAELAPKYAPDVNERMVGAAIGGVLVDPAHNLHYVEGTGFWAGVMAMALVGIARAFEIETELAPYLSTNGARIFHEMQTVSIVNVLGQYPGMKWADLVIPDYPTPEKLPLFVQCANKLIMGTGGTPTIPLFIGQGANGELLEGTPGDKKKIGAGDGVMVAGDVRTLARDYCAKGTKVHYEEYKALSHIWSVPIWLLDQAALRRRTSAGELFVDPERELAQADSAPKVPLALQHSLEDRQHQRGRHEPSRSQRQLHLQSARDHRRAAMVGGLQRVGDNPFGGNMGESRYPLDQEIGVVGGLELGRHRTRTDRRDRHTGVGDFGVDPLRQPQHIGLGGGVVGVVGRRLKARHRRQVDDRAAAALDHAGQVTQHQVGHRLDVDAQHL
jgi:hypothetical protein